MSKFKPGVSGNPRGKPKGTINPSTQLRRAIAADLPEIIGVLRQQALGGDVAAARLLLERALPALRPEVQAKALSAAGNSLGQRAEAVIAATLAGQLSATTGAELVGLLAANARIFETAELEGRIAALEATHATST